MEPTEFNELSTLVLAAAGLTPTERKLFDCLLRHPNGIDEAGIAQHLYPNQQLTKLQGRIRAEVHRARGKLESFFKYHPQAKKHQLCLHIPNGTPYRVEDARQPNLDPVEMFWDQHFGNGAPNMIVYTEPLFFFDEKKRCYIRYLEINDESPSIDTETIRAKLPPNHPSRKLQPCFHYQSSGETQAQRILRKWFDQQGPVNVEVSRECIDKEVWRHNVIALGNSRTNKRVLLPLQEGLHFQIQDDRLVVKRHGQKHRYDLFDLRPSPKDRAGRYIYAAVTRRESLAKGRCATLIAANHGRAIEKMAEYLTTPHALQQLYVNLPAISGPSLPTRFQLLFRIQTVDFELAPGDPELIDFAI